MKRNALLFTLIATSALLSSAAMAADPIEDTWKRPEGTLIQYASAGGDTYCGTVLTGEYANQSIGCLTGSNGTYQGSVNKLDEGKTYTGKATVTGNILKLSGCVLGGIICKSENLTRQ